MDSRRSVVVKVKACRSSSLLAGRDEQGICMRMRSESNLVGVVICKSNRAIGRSHQIQEAKYDEYARAIVQTGGSNFRLSARATW